MNVTEKEKQFDFVENFVEKDIPAKATSQYVFDIKA
jgi:hypothetical protein